MTPNKRLKLSYRKKSIVRLTQVKREFPRLPGRVHDEMAKYPSEIAFLRATQEPFNRAPSLSLCIPNLYMMGMTGTFYSKRAERNPLALAKVIARFCDEDVEELFKRGRFLLKRVRQEVIGPRGGRKMAYVEVGRPKKEPYRRPDLVRKMRF